MIYSIDELDSKISNLKTNIEEVKNSISKATLANNEFKQIVPNAEVDISSFLGPQQKLLNENKKELHKLLNEKIRISISKDSHGYVDSRKITETLIKNPNIASVHFTNNILTITVENLKSKLTNSTKYKMYPINKGGDIVLTLPRLVIIFYLESKQTFIHIDEERGFEPSETYIEDTDNESPRKAHPHIHDDGIPCFGDFHNQIEKAANDLKIIEYTSLVLSFLSTINNTDHYGKHWYTILRPNHELRTLQRICDTRFGSKETDYERAGSLYIYKIQNIKYIPYNTEYGILPDNTLGKHNTRKIIRICEEGTYTTFYYVEDIEEAHPEDNVREHFKLATLRDYSREVSE